MVSLSEMLKIKKEREKIIGKRTSITRFLLLLGSGIWFLILGSLFIWPFIRLHVAIKLGILIAGLVLVVLSLIAARKYRKSRTEEQIKKRGPLKDMIKPLSLIVLLLGLIIYGFTFFNDFLNKWQGDQEPELVLFVIVTIVLSIFFASLPFIMALWYKTSPTVATKIIMKLYGLVNRPSKKKITEVFVLKIPQKHSVYISFKRAFDGLAFSLFFTYTIYFPLIFLITRGDPNNWLNPFFVPSSQDIRIWALFFAGSVLNNVVPITISYTIWFWVFPPCWLLDDAGVVFFRSFLERRQPAELKTISSWFLSMVKSGVGTSGLITYLLAIYNNWHSVGYVSDELGVMVVPKFIIFFIGFPLLGSLLMCFILILFLESQFNKLKTFIYQELVKSKVDPRVVKIKLTRLDEFQENTLSTYYGENYLHSPPLIDSVKEFGDAGEIKTEK
ncbi:MAG: hypothetical protein ACTSWN_11175 [Promethearchaeota archaeon]